MTLPRGWSEISLAEIGRWGSGGTPRASDANFYNGDIPWIRSGDLPDGPIAGHSVTISEAGLASSSAKWVQPNSVLIAMYGATIGKVGLTTYPVTTNQAVAFVEPAEGIGARFVFGNLRARKEAFIALGQGGAQPNISQEIIRAQQFALPPTAEQHRIVAKLDALTARLARARAELNRINGLVMRLRSGAIQWATEYGAGVPRAAATPLREVLIRFRTGPFGSSVHKHDYVNGGTPLINPTHIVAGRIRAARETSVELTKAAELMAFRLSVGDVILGRRGEMGRCAVVTEADEGSLIGTGSMALTPSSELAPEYLQLFLSSPRVIAALERAAVGSTMVNLNQSILLSLPIFLPCREDQERRVAGAHAGFARADRLEAEAARARVLLDRLESAILAKAFRGELVPQDPDDEPASVLLDRIRAQRAASPPARRGRRRAAA